MFAPLWLLSSILALAAEALPGPDPVTGCVPDDGQIYQFELDVEDGLGGMLTRDAVVFLPPAPPPDDEPRTLVVLLHGGGETPFGIAATTGLDTLRNSEGFVLAAVRGTGEKPTWTAGDGCCGADERARVDDVLYLESITAELVDLLCIDRVWAVGFSAGGMMAHRWAWQGTQVDGLLAVAGTLQVMYDEGEGTVPVWHVHGAADDQIPEAGESDPEEPSPSEPWWGYASVDLGIEDAWAVRNGWDGSDPEVTYKGDYDCRAYATTTATRWCTVAGLGHSWPAPDPEFGDLATRGWAWFQGASIP
ncbi:MAG: poly(3-hydroxybutyrate) depolymerase [Myxococcota bacterium]|jgi:poly(3-hydroxybutyrate) depolymerase